MPSNLLDHILFLHIDMESLFHYEKLMVYRQALAFCATTQPWIEAWPAKHSICDHLPRAADSVIDNLAAANATFTSIRRTVLDYAIGSTLECAACLDIAHAKDLLTADLLILHKSAHSGVIGHLIRDKPATYSGINRPLIGA